MLQLTDSASCVETIVCESQVYQRAREHKTRPAWTASTILAKIIVVDQIGTIRREYLDRVFFWNAVDLARKLSEFRDYYNARRVHRSLNGTPPAQRSDGSAASPAALDHYVWRQHCRRLFQIPLAA